MQYVKTDTDHSFYIEFVVDNELVVPDDGSVTATITEADGTVKTGFNELALSPTAGQSFVVLETTSAINDKDDEFELRQIEIKFTHNSKPHTQYINYRIVDRVNIPVSCDEVRATLGISVDEWEDSNIDLVAAFAEVEEELAEQDIDATATLEAGTAIVRNLLNAVKYKAAMSILPAIEIIAVQSLQADNVMFRRFEKVDFMALRARLEGQYITEIGLVTEESDVLQTYAIVATGTDAVTGE